MIREWTNYGIRRAMHFFPAPPRASANALKHKVHSVTQTTVALGAPSCISFIDAIYLPIKGVNTFLKKHFFVVSRKISPDFSRHDSPCIRAADKILKPILGRHGIVRQTVLHQTRTKIKWNVSLSVSRAFVPRNGQVRRSRRPPTDLEDSVYVERERSKREIEKARSKVEESTRGFVVGRGASLALDVCTSSTEKPVSPFSSARTFRPRRACRSIRERSPSRAVGLLRTARARDTRGGSNYISQRRRVEGHTQKYVHRRFPFFSNFAGNRRRRWMYPGIKVNSIDTNLKL